MNENTQKQLVRQLKVLNFWVSFFGSIVIIVMLVLTFLVFKVVTFVGDTNTRIDNIKTSVTDELNAKKKLCEGEGAVSNLVKERTNFCN